MATYSGAVASVTYTKATVSITANYISKNRKESDEVDLSDAIAITVGKNITDNILVNQALALTMNKNLTDTVTIVDDIDVAVTLGKNISDTVDTDDEALLAIRDLATAILINGSAINTHTLN